MDCGLTKVRSSSVIEQPSSRNYIHRVNALSAAHAPRARSGSTLALALWPSTRLWQVQPAGLSSDCSH